MTEATLDGDGASVLEPTSLEDIKKLNTHGEEVVILPSFMDGTPFTAKVRRPAILRMAKDGRIPNTLSAAVDDLMDVSATSARTGIAERTQVLEIIAAACLVEPTYEQVEEHLDYVQLMALWSYVMNGVNSLIPFRAFRELFSASTYKRAVQDTPVAVPEPD
jgi:hypothetical protein